MDNWEEVKTAYTVGLLGTVTAASEALGVHRATVIRHIDALESRLDEKLFIRHTNGYTPTSAGEELIRIVKVTDDQFRGLSARIKGQSSSLSGDLIVTTLDALTPFLLPAIRKFSEQHDDVRTVLVTTEQVLRLEYGEAHIALRPGMKPISDDNEVRHFGVLQFGLYATESYLDTHGTPKSLEDVKNEHRIIRLIRVPMTSFEHWISHNIPEQNIVLECTSPFGIYRAILNHIGIGFLPNVTQKDHPELIEIVPADMDWRIPLWVVMHKDMSRTEKVIRFLEVLEDSNPLRNI